MEPAWFYPAINNAIQASVGPAVQAAIGPAVQAAVGPAVQAAIGPAVQAAVGPAVQAVIGPAVQAAVQEAMVPLRAEIFVLSCKISNLVANRDEDVLHFFPKADEPVPLNFPHTVGELKMLPVGDTLTSIETYYSLPHQGSLPNRKRRISITIGHKS